MLCLFISTHRIDVFKHPWKTKIHKNQQHTDLMSVPKLEGMAKVETKSNHSSDAAAPFVDASMGSASAESVFSPFLPV